MIEASVSPLSHVPPESFDPDNPSYSFDVLSWVTPPEVPESIASDPKYPDIALLLTKYRSTASPTDWHRYLTLGLHAFPDGNDFDNTWNEQPVDWTTRFRLVWYHYKYHFDNSIEIPIKLHNWATQLAKPFLRIHDVHFLDIDTHSTKWPDVVQDATEVAAGWTRIPDSKDKIKPPKKQVTYNFNLSKAESTTRIRPPSVNASSLATAARASAISELTTLTQTKALDKPTPPATSRQQILDRLAATGVAKAIANWEPDPAPLPQPPPDKHSPPALTLPTVIPTLDRPTPMQTDDMSDAKQSAFRPLLNVPTHDGTQRIIIRWSPTQKGLSPDRRPEEWTNAALGMLKELIQEEHGVFYRWESQDLGTWRTATDLKAEDLRDFISPKITYVQAHGMFVFGVRFGFAAKTPIAWKFQDSTRQAMKTHKVWCTVSNASCDGGNLTYAGFILMKAPNTTHPIRYLQSLRNRLPENSPFFDIVLLKRTPLEQPIHHLAIQCGENHVVPLTKALSSILTGKGSAAFLPRVVLGSLTKEQIAKYFIAHSNYVKSLRTICLSPMVTNLDTVREEFFDNGDVLKRTTREWATSMVLPSTGALARCDIVNGGKNHIVNLLAPRHVFAEVQAEVNKYKLRINPMERREARFLDNIPGLPEVIHIDTSVQQSLDCLEQLSSEAIWQQAPPGVRDHLPAAATASLHGPPVPSASRPSRTTDSIASHITGITDLSEDTSQFHRNTGKAKSTKTGAVNLIRSQDSTASTQSATLTMATYNLEFEKYDKLIASQQDQLDSGFATSNSNWQELKQQLSEQNEAQNNRFDDLHLKVTKTMKHVSATNTSIASVQSEMASMMIMLKTLTRQKESRKRARPIGSAQVVTATAMISQPPHSMPSQHIAAPHPNAPSIASEDALMSESQEHAPPDSATKRQSVTDAIEQMSLGSIDDDASFMSEPEFNEEASMGNIDLLIDVASDLDQDAYSTAHIAATQSGDPSPAPNSPPLDSQYNIPRDPAGGAND